MRVQTKMMQLCFWAIVCCLSVVFSGANSAYAQSTMQKMVQEKTLKVGWISAPPTAYKDLKTGEVTGIYIDIVKFIMEQAKVKVEFYETSWSTFAAGLQAKQFDIVAAGTFASIPRATAVNFTSPIFYLGYTAAVRKGETRFKTLADIDKPGIKVAVILGSGGHEYVKRAFKNAEIMALNTSDLTASLAAVNAKRADAAIEDQWAARRYIEENPSMHNLFPDKPFNLQPIAWPVRQGDMDFLQFMNTSIEWMRINGMTDLITQRYPNSARFVADESYRSLDK
jgi:polar amino acid transport system substrate-binding protein